MEETTTTAPVSLKEVSELPPLPPVDWDAVAGIAATADTIAEDKEKPKRMTKRQAAKLGTVDNPEVIKKDKDKPAVVDTTSDPVMRSGIVALVDFSVDMTKNALNYSEPGKQWRAQLGEVSARIVMRYLQPGQTSDIVLLCSLIGIWVSGNMFFPGTVNNAITKEGGK